MANVFIACPNNGGVMSMLTARSIWGTASQVHRLLPVSQAISLTPGIAIITGAWPPRAR